MLNIKSMGFTIIFLLQILKGLEKKILFLKFWASKSKLKFKFGFTPITQTFHNKLEEIVLLQKPVLLLHQIRIATTGHALLIIMTLIIF